MPISLKRINSNTTGTKLEGLQANYTINATNATYGAPVGLSGLNISAGLVEVVNINVPSGKRLKILNTVLFNIGATGNLDVEVDIDGVKVLQSINPSYTSPSATILGSGLSGTYNTAVLDLIVESNFKLRLSRAGATSASLSVTYVVVV